MIGRLIKELFKQRDLRTQIQNDQLHNPLF